MCSGLFQPPGWLKHIASSTQCPLLFSLSEDNVPLGAERSAVGLSTSQLTFCNPGQSARECEGLSPIVVAPRWPSNYLVIQLLVEEPWPLPIRQDLLSQAQAGNYPPHSAACPLRLY